MTHLDLGLADGPEADRIRAFLEEANAGHGSSPIDVRIPVGDDAAALRLPDGHQLVVSSDASVEAIHFRREWMTWETIGYRAAASSLSDLAAMAAQPIGIMVSAALPPESDIDVPRSLGRGVGAAVRRAGAIVLGGDLVASPGPVFLDVTVLGHAEAPVGRGGASPGDELWVTGTLGGAAVAVHDLGQQLEPHPAARAAFERPTPRIQEALWLSERLELSAAIDLSDGLIRDAGHLAAASNLGIDIDLDRVPTPEPLQHLRGTPAGGRLLLTGGEDYELLFAAPPGTVQPVAAAFETTFAAPLTRVGSVSDVPGVRAIGADGIDLGAGFDHFGGLA